MRRIPWKVLTHDEYTAEILRKKGISALFVGNPMMDELVPGGIDLGEPPVVGILPGSRSEAYKNFIKILKVVERVKETVTFVCALPQSLKIERIIHLARQDEWIYENGVFRKNEKAVLVVRNAFEDVISKSEIVIGLAGTANEQAAGLGNPVVSFTGYGPQTTLRRMKDQARLLGEAVKFVSDFPNGVVTEISFLLSNPGRKGLEEAKLAPSEWDLQEEQATLPSSWWSISIFRGLFAPSGDFLHLHEIDNMGSFSFLQLHGDVPNRILDAGN